MNWGKQIKIEIFFKKGKKNGGKSEIIRKTKGEVSKTEKKVYVGGIIDCHCFLTGTWMAGNKVCTVLSQQYCFLPLWNTAYFLSHNPTTYKLNIKK